MLFPVTKVPTLPNEPAYLAWSVNQGIPQRLSPETSLLRSNPANALDQTKRRPDKESHMRMFSNAMGDRKDFQKLLSLILL